MVEATSKCFLNLLILLLVANTLAETHVVLDQLDKTVINLVTESPFVIHQPHSLVDFLNQIKWVEELSRSYNTIKRQQVSIEKRYDDDDPEIEKKIRSTDPNCVESQPLDLQTENFLKTYTSDLAPNFILHSDLPLITTYFGVPSTIDTFQLNYLHRLFSVETSIGKFREPYCETYVFSAWANEIASEAETLSDAPEPEFTELDESELLKIATFLTERLEEEKNARWACYYSSFYWRIKGNSKAALRCLLYNLDLDPEPIAAKFQLATLYLKHGKYSKAVQYLEVLDGNFQAATVAYEEAYKKNPDYVIAHKKDGSSALCSENRLQAKLAYQYYTLGPMPHLSCRGLTKPAENGKPELSRLYCGVDNWKLYNESLIDKYQQQLLSAKTKKIEDEINQVELFETEKLRYEKLSNAEMDEYLTKLSPFVAMRADEPQLSPKYPLNSDRKSSVKFFERTWPSIEECKIKYVPEDHLELPPFFLSPENKGFIVSELLTKYLALDNAADISPLPWQIPDCEVVNSPDVGVFFGSESIEEMLDGYSKSSFVNGKRLRSALLTLIEPSGESASSKVSIGDLGNRISLLLKYNIGPRWISTNLAALFYRYLGMTNQAIKCLKEAIKTNLYTDVAYVQLAEILYLEAPKNNCKYAERILGLALEDGPYEPLIYYLLGFIHQSKGNDRIAEKMLLQSLDIDPELGIASDLLFRLRCKKKMNKAVCSSKIKSGCPKEYCFKLELNNQKKLEYIYYRCNAVYTGKSYKPPAFAYFIAPLLKTADELRQLEMRNLVKKVYKEVTDEDEASDRYPVFPLDYSDDQVVYAHQQKINQQNLDMLHQYSVSFSEDEIEKNDDSQLRNNKIYHNLSDDLPNASLPPIESVVERQEILKYDIVRSEKSLPVPNSTLVAEGSATMKPMTLEESASYCSNLKEDGKVLDKQFSSTYVSVGIFASAKGVDIRDYMVLPPNADEHKVKLLEPICPSTQESSSILLELDSLPAYKYHDKFKFYRPERGLMVTALQTLGDDKKQRIEHVATTLSLSMQQAQEGGEAPHWSLTTASALYWRVKGDSENAIKCLRHAISNSPDEMKDVSLISLANIYYQAGFLNSALTVAGKALDMSPNSMVAVHFYFS